MAFQIQSNSILDTHYPDNQVYAYQKWHYNDVNDFSDSDAEYQLP